MTKNEFTKLCDTYGAQLNRWPVNQQNAARTFIQAEPDFCRAQLDQAETLDTMLTNARITPGTDLLKARILSELPKSTTSVTPITVHERRKHFGYPSVAALMAMAFIIGFAGANLTHTNNSSTQLQLADNIWQDLSSEYGMHDLYEWVDSGEPE